MPALSNCPAEKSLHCFLIGQCPPSEAVAIEQHLETCEHCLSTLQRAANQDALVEALRAQACIQQNLDNETVQEVIQRVKRLLPSGAEAAEESPSATAEMGFSTVTPRPGPEEDQPEDRPGGLSDDLTEDGFAFLSAPEAPGELGRLGAFRVLRELGRGGMGVVFQASDPILKRHVALKVIHPAVAARPSARPRFLREARAVAAIQHDHVVSIHQADEAAGVLFLVMPLLQGETLDRRLKRENRLSLAEALRIGREVAEGLAAAHERGVIHRDIKPSNIWLEEVLSTSEGKKVRVKILDFGLARACDDTGLTGSHTVGTPLYMAPEQVEGQAVDGRSDLFSLGCVLYRICTGRHPFRGVYSAALGDRPAPVREWNPDVPAALDELVMKLLKPCPESRPASAAVVIQAIQQIERSLEAVGATVPVALPVKPAAEPANPWAGLREGTTEEIAPPPSRPGAKRLRRRAALVATAVLLAAVAGLLGAITFIKTDQGTFAVEAGPDIEVKLEKVGLKLIDRKSGRQFLVKRGQQQLPSGDYELEVTEATSDLTFSSRTFSIRRGRETVMQVWFKQREVKPPEPLTADWIKEVAKLPARKQVEAVVEQLKKRNPGFDDKVTPQIKDGVVTSLSFLTDNVTDLSPVRALPGLREITCFGSAIGKGKLENLRPLAGMKLTSLDCSNTRVLDLTPLEGMPLARLHCTHTRVLDLTPLKGMSTLRNLSCASTKVSDLTPLKDMPLTHLYCGGTGVLDLTPLKGMPLAVLSIADTKVPDLLRLQGMKLTELYCQQTPIADLTPLKGMPLKVLACGYSKVSDLSPLAGMKLEHLGCESSQVKDLEPLKGMTLVSLSCSNTLIADLAPLKGMKLETLYCDGAQVADLTPLADMKLRTLDCSNTRVADLSPLKNMPLVNLRCSFQPDRDTALLRSLKTLKTINGKPAEEFWKAQSVKPSGTKP